MGDLDSPSKPLLGDDWSHIAAVVDILAREGVGPEDLKRLRSGNGRGPDGRLVIEALLRGAQGEPATIEEARETFAGLVFGLEEWSRFGMELGEEERERAQLPWSKAQLAASSCLRDSECRLGEDHFLFYLPERLEAKPVLPQVLPSRPLTLRVLRDVCRTAGCWAYDDEFQPWPWGNEDLLLNTPCHPGWHMLYLRGVQLSNEAVAKLYQIDEFVPLHYYRAPASTLFLGRFLLHLLEGCNAPSPYGPRLLLSSDRAPDGSAVVVSGDRLSPPSLRVLKSWDDGFCVGACRKYPLPPLPQ